MSPALKRSLVAFVVVLLGSLGYWWMRGSPQSRTHSLFLDIEAGVEMGDASTLIAALDESYDINGTWPQLAGFGSSDSDERKTATRILQPAFFQERTVKRDFTAIITGLEPVTDNEWRATTTIGLQADGGSQYKFDPIQIVFTLRDTGGLLPAMRIVKHDPIPLR